MALLLITAVYIEPYEEKELGNSLRRVCCHPLEL